MKNYRRIEKGTVLGGDCFYVVISAAISDGKLWLQCVCDNANNRYAFSLDEVLETKDPHKRLIMDPHTAVSRAGWGPQLTDEDEEIFDKMGREIPLGIIAEVLAGVHDDRFDDNEIG